MTLEVGSEWLRCATVGRVEVLRARVGGDLGTYKVGDVPLFEATGRSTRWLLDHQASDGKSALILALIGMEKGLSAQIRRGCEAVFHFLLNEGAVVHELWK